MAYIYSDSVSCLGQFRNSITSDCNVFEFLSVHWRTTQKEYLLHKEKTRAFVFNKIEQYNKIYNFTFNRISIKNQKSRWGSCSSRKNINFNYRLGLISEHLAEYVVVHELCHLEQLNHSQAFWDLVAITIPDYKRRRSELKKIRI